MGKKIVWFLFVFLAISIGLYPVIYLILGTEYALLSGKPADLLESPLWMSGFYLHILSGGLALLIGWMQFRQKLRRNRPRLHRNIGKGYMVLVILSGVSAMYIALFAFGGLISTVGFMSLATIWLSTTLLGWRAAITGAFARHERWMMLSYAACFAAVTLRIWLPLLQLITGDFTLAYQIVAWLCWVPNLLIGVIWVLRKRQPQPIPQVPTPSP